MYPAPLMGTMYPPSSAIFAVVGQWGLELYTCMPDIVIGLLYSFQSVVVARSFPSFQFYPTVPHLLFVCPVYW